MKIAAFWENPEKINQRSFAELENTRHHNSETREFPTPFSTPNTEIQCAGRTRVLRACATFARFRSARLTPRAARAPVRQHRNTHTHTAHIHTHTHKDRNRRTHTHTLRSLEAEKGCLGNEASDARWLPSGFASDPRAAVNLSLSGHRRTEESEDTEHSQDLHRFSWTSDCAALHVALNLNSERIYLRITYIFEVTPVPVLAGRIYLEKIGAAFPFHAKDRNSMSR